MSSKHQCGQCHAQFAYKSKLQRHMETHMITGDWLCGLCDTLINRFDVLLGHWRKSCPEMKILFGVEELKKMSSDDLQEAAFRHTLEQYSLEEQQTPSCSEIMEPDTANLTNCVYCGLSLPRETVKSHYRVHLRLRSAGERIRNSQIPFLCDVCGFGFKFKKSLFRHWRTKCSELLAHNTDSLEISNENLKILVEDVVRAGETIEATVAMDRGAMDFEEEDSEEPEDVECTSTFTAPISPPDSADFKDKWAVNQPKAWVSCDFCKNDTKFSSIGRKLRHENLMHQDLLANEKSIKCKLCMTKFKEERVLIAHLREHCRAMRVEEPDRVKRKRMSVEQLRDVVAEARGRWTELFETKKRENLKFIEKFLADIDRKRSGSARGRMNEAVVILPIPQQYVRDASMAGVDYPCSLCKEAIFPNYRTLRLHQQTVHQNRPRNQITITTTSLLPYFRLETAIFYDASGFEYKMGKHIDNNTDLVRHVKDKVLEAGDPVDLDPEKSCYLVQLTRNDMGDKVVIMLSPQEIGEVCDVTGRLKDLYTETPQFYDDWPLLTREC